MLMLRELAESHNCFYIEIKKLQIKLNKYLRNYNKLYRKRQRGIEKDSELDQRLPLKIFCPDLVNLHTCQSGFTGLLNQGSAQPFSMQDLIVRSLIRLPFESKIGSFPPGCVSPHLSHASWAAVGLWIFPLASRMSDSDARGFSLRFCISNSLP